jgi:chromosome segregation protein
VYLSGLEIHGFKSFPNKVKLSFTPGVMSIVGPNGCGKTNIVDAVRWVLGEQRSSVLRSDKMENVIFAGSGAHKLMQHAEVTIIIENSHGVLPSEYTEIAITRKLNRDGDSEYLINRRPGRLKDIKNLFADTGLGPDSYSIIELKMVENILSSRADERRKLFEEAAGVTLYKARLKTTRHRLHATQGDMVRLEDLLTEITSRRNSLKRQVAKAKRYRYLKSALRVKEIFAAANEMQELRTRITPQQQRIVNDRQTKLSLEKLIQSGDEELASLRGRLGSMEENLGKLRQSREELEKRNQAAQRDIAMLEERLRSGQTHGNERDSEEKELIKRRGEIAVSIEEMDEKNEKAKSREHEIRLRLESMDISWSEYEERANEINRIRDRQESVRRDTENSVIRLESEEKQNSRRLEQISERTGQLEKTNNDISDNPDSDDIKSEFEELKVKLSHIHGEIDTVRRKREEYREDRAAAENGVASTMRDLEAAKRRVKFLEAMVSGGEGRPKAVKSLLSSGLKDILGRLGDAVVVEEEDRLAVAAALEEVTSTVITNTRSALKDAASFLMDNDHGRGLLTSVDNLLPDEKISHNILNNPNVIGPLISRVKTKGNSGKVIDRFLRNVILVKDLDTLLELSEEASKQRITLVTVDGCRYTPDGILTIGKSDPGDLGAADLLDKANIEKTECDSRLAELNQKVEKLRVIENETQGLLNQATLNHKETQSELDTARRRMAKMDADIQEFEALRKRRTSEIASLNSEYDSINSRQEELRVEFRRSKSQFQDANDSLESTQELIQGIQEEGRSLRSARDRIREQQVEASSSVERLQGEVRRLGALLDEIGRRLTRISEERVELSGAMEDAGERLRHVQAEEAIIEKDLKETTEIFAKQQEEYNILRRDFAEKDGHISVKRSELSSIADRLHATEMEVADLKHRMTTVREKIVDNYEIDLLTARQEHLPLAVEEDNPYMEKPLGEIRDELRDIGPVNQMAVEEFEIIDGRWKQITEQHDDLTEAINTLEETIKEINGIARERFLATFTRVEGHFVSLFSRLFGGGDAALSLAEGDPLEAGIQIFASPKGKKLSSIDLLSGGEKAMTAIALLFALYLERPSPFCFLDEVDAPLDDVNVVRFNRLLREFTDRTQFLVVTHNKLTMERADLLYGVTMEEEGISRMVAVEIGKRG